MTDRKLTLFELHFDGGFQIGPKTIGGDRSDEAVDEETTDEATGIDVAESGETESGGRRILPRVAALALLVGIVLGVRRFVGGDDLDGTTLDEEFETAEGDDIDVEA